MCGIAGIWGEPTADRLRAMAHSLRHRGPDDETFWHATGGTLGLAHRRLSIIDVEGGKQPIANEDGSVTTIFNGAIYNYRELREELIAKGHHFKTQSDTEVIVHLYEEHGAELAVKLRGMFAIAIWDDRDQQLVLIRDRSGKKPLYYSDAGGEFLFASQIRGIVAGSRCPLDIDTQAIADYLAWCCIPAPGTIYKQVRAVLPAEIMIVRDSAVASRQSYWQQPVPQDTKLSRYEAVEKVEALLRTAVDIRLRADVPVGTFLSGGIDSGIVTAMAAQAYTGKLTTITVGFEDGAFDERPLARQVARRYDTDHHEVLLRPDIASDLPEIAQAYDQPYGDSSAVPSWYVAKAARQFTRVVLNGDGGDELFGGYRRYVAAQWNGRFRWADGPIARPAWRTLGSILPTPGGYRTPYAFFHRWIRGMGLDWAARYMAWAIDGFDKPSLRKLCAGRDIGTALQADEIERSDRLAHSTLGRLQECGAIARMMGTDFATVLPCDLLVKIDIAAMASGLEARSPFLDHELVEVVSRYPDRLKLRGFETKPLLRELAGRYLPKTVQRAPKRGFEVPLTRWIRGDLRELSRNVILARQGLLADLFDRQALERLVEQREPLEPARWSRRVWLLLMLGLWDHNVRKK